MSSLPQDPWACAAGSRGCCSMFEEVLLNPPFRDKGGSLFVLLSCSITGHLA